MNDRDDHGPSARAAELAELDAGLVDGRAASAAEVARRRADAATDPRSAAVLDALAATRADLTAAAAVPVPPANRQRWADLVEELHDEQAADEHRTVEHRTGTGPGERAPSVVVPLRRRRWYGRTAVAAAAAAAVVVAGIAGTAEPRPLVTDASLVGVALATRGVQDVGGLADPQDRAACLAAVGAAASPDAQLVAGRRIDFSGRPATLLLLGTGRLGVFDLVVVDDDCATLLAQRRVP